MQPLYLDREKKPIRQIRPTEWVISPKKAIKKIMTIASLEPYNYDLRSWFSFSQIICCLKGEKVKVHATQDIYDKD